MQDKKRGLYKVNAPTETCNYKPFACKTILPLFLKKSSWFQPFYQNTHKALFSDHTHL